MLKKSRVGRPRKILPLVGPQLIPLEYRLQDIREQIHFALGRDEYDRLADELIKKDGGFYLLPVVRTAAEAQAIRQ